MRAKRQKGAKTKFTMLLDEKERAALEKKAKADGRSAASLLRRFILGLTALALVACGGNDFSTQDAGGSGGMMQTAGAGMGGAPMAGSGGAGGAYEGPAWVDCSGHSLVARGIAGKAEKISFSVTAETRGTGWRLAGFALQINGKLAEGFEMSEDNKVSAPEETLLIGLSEITGSVSVSESDTLEFQLGWSPVGGGEILEADVIRCSASVDGAPVAQWP